MAGTFAGAKQGTLITLVQSKQKATYVAVGWAFPNTWSIEEGVGFPTINMNPYSFFAGTKQGTLKTKDQVLIKATYTAVGWVFDASNWKIEEGSSYPYRGTDPVFPPSNGEIPKIFARPTHSIKLGVSIGFRVGI